MAQLTRMTDFILDLDRVRQAHTVVQHLRHATRKGPVVSYCAGRWCTSEDDKERVAESYFQ